MHPVFIILSKNVEIVDSLLRPQNFKPIPLLEENVVY